MTLDTTAISACIRILCTEVPYSQIEQLVKKLRDKTITLDSTATKVQSTIGLRDRSLVTVMKILKKWDEDEAALSKLLDISLRLIKEVKSTPNDVTLVWTGPIQFPIPARATQYLMKEMIDSAETRITIVGYLVTAGAKTIFDAMVNKSNYGVTCRIVLDKAEEQMNIIENLWGTITPFPQVFGLTQKRKGGRRLLHAKLMVIDRKEVLITSANLTYQGLKNNIEIGVRIRGKVASKVDDLITKLIESDEIKKIR
tara:strand:+ start:2918 stop:3682 length:765 start_codon:yes stop_codon:yes gene_type:complete